MCVIFKLQMYRGTAGNRRGGRSVSHNASVIPMAVVRAFLLLLRLSKQPPSVPGSVRPSSLHLSLRLSAYWTLLDTPTFNSTGMLFHRLLLLLVPFVMREGSEVMISVSAQIHVRVHLFSWLWTGPCLNL